MNSLFCGTMNKQFPLPENSGFGCMPLKLGSIISALIVMLQSVLALAQYFATTSLIPINNTPDYAFILNYGLVVTVSTTYFFTFFITAIMLVGVLRKRPRLIRPWVIWTSLQVAAYIILFIVSTIINKINNLYSTDNSLPINFIEILSLLLRAYMLILVASYYKQLEEGSEWMDRADESLNSLMNEEMTTV